MMCDRCNAKVANVHLTEIVNKKKQEIHLCEDCASKHGVSVKAVFAGSTPLGNPPVLSKTKLVLKDDFAGVTCPVCGMTFADFRSSGRLGCGNDYAVFKKGLLPLLHKIHGATQHRGKVPARASRRLAKQREIVQLRKRLNAAIQREAYEEAATLRDHIYELEER